MNDRFVLPVLPIALIFSGYAFAQMEVSGSSSSSVTKKKQVPRQNHTIKWSPKLRLSVFFLLATNIPMALYMSLFHQVKKLITWVLSLVSEFTLSLSLFVLKKVLLFPTERNRGCDELLIGWSIQRESKEHSLSHAVPFYSLLFHSPS